MAEIKKVRYTHDALIDTIIAHPATSQRELATIFGYTEGWLSQIMSSDSFKVRLAARREQLVDPVLVQNVEERLEGIAGQAMDIISEKLAINRNADLAVKALELSTRALGYGARDRSQVNVQNNFVVALPTKANSSGEWQNEHNPRVLEQPTVRPVITLDTVITEQEAA